MNLAGQALFHRHKCVRTAPSNVPVFNPAFDITPHDLISGIITEKGIMTGNYEEEIEQLFRGHIGWSGPNSGNLPDFLGIAFLYRDISAAFDLCIKCR